MLVLSGASIVDAQLSLTTDPSSNAFLQQQIQREQESRLAAERALPLTQKFAADWGGWFDWYNFTFYDGIRHRVEWTYDLRLWGNFQIDEGINEGYVRGRLGWVHWSNDSGYYGNNNDTVGPNLERGWYQFDITKALRKYAGVNSPLSLRTKVGRDLINVGSGYTVSLPLDSVVVQAELYNFETNFIVGKTPGSTPNIDTSRPVAGESNRVFWIVEERYKGFPLHEPFVYYVAQRDHTREDPIDLLQNFNYDSDYVGFGSTGQIVRNLRYNTEWVFENGDSYGDRKFLHRNDIRAWGFDQELEYLFSHPMQPRVGFEYMFASGDPDRLGSPTNAEGGNIKGHIDNSFVAFGFRDTGLSYAPRLSNIQIWKFSGSFLPVPDVRLLKNMELGLNVFIYAKNRTNAAVSDPLATENSAYLGWETDYFMNYRITSDFALTVRYGLFFPGSAYDSNERETRPFLLSGFTWSF